MVCGKEASRRAWISADIEEWTEENTHHWHTGSATLECGPRPGGGSERRADVLVADELSRIERAQERVRVDCIGMLIYDKLVGGTELTLGLDLNETEEG